MHFKNENGHETSRPTRTLCWVVLIAASLFISQAAIAKTEPQEEKEATKVLGALCVPNFYKVSDELYRSAQFNCKGGVENLVKVGIKTVISLRHWHEDSRQLLTKAASNISGSP
jgi:hypothetical protein